jgi:uncharacterized protein YcbK (DUF882 family)
MTKNFLKTEFESKDGAPMPIDVYFNILALADNLQILRDHLHRPIKINSGYRSPEHNRAVGGADESQHVLGKAADIVVEGLTPIEVKIAIETLIIQGELKKGGLSAYDTFTHYDIRGYNARW